MNKNTGRIIKGIGGFYYVQTDSDVIECRARGVFRNKSVTPYVGDIVEIEISDDGSGYIQSIKDRKNCFIRPPISNIDLLIIVVAMKNPSPDLLFLDKMLIQASVANVNSVICLNKSDLVSDEICEKTANVYRNLGYSVFITSVVNNIGIDDIRDIIKGKVISVCGFSGVGKSSVLNALLGDDWLQVGEISKKLSRGKHTTREVSLVEYNDGTYLADTPGFSSLELPESVNKDNLKDYFVEFSNYDHMCKFSDCNHIAGKFCGIYDAFNKGIISESRYKNYINLYEMLKEKKEWK